MTAPVTIDAPRGPVTGPAISPQQRWVWLADRLAGRTAAYNVPEALRVRGALDPAVLGRALRYVVARHEPLRTSYAELDGRAVPIVRDPEHVSVRVVDVSGDADPAGRAADLARREAERPFDLDHDVSVRLSAVKVGDEEWLLVLVVHHIAADAWSMSLLWRELGTAYSAEAAGRAPDLPPLTIRYADHTAHRVATSDADRQLAHWRRRLDGLVPLNQPTDRPRPAVRDGRGGTLSFDLPDDLGPGVRALATDTRATPFAVLLAAFAVVLHRWSGQSDLAIGTPFAVRPQVELEALVGLFVNMTVLRTELADDPPFADLVRRIGAEVLDAYDHQDVPFSRLVEELQPVRDPSRNPLFDVMFTVEDEPTTAFDVPGMRVEPVAVASATAKFDLALAVIDGGGRLRGSIEYATDIYEPATVSRLAGHYRRVLTDAVAAPGTRVSELAMLTDDEYATLVRDHNATEAAYPVDRLVHERFADAARRHPEATAVRFGASRVSYGELAARVDRLAARLVARGIGSDRTVALCLDRTPELITAVLGVLRTGGAYVPVDPAYPAERIAHVLDDCGARLVVTTTARLAALDLPAGVAAICLDVEDDAGAGPDRAPDAAPLMSPDNLAYIIYTSGSTGRPKGVMVPHRGVLNLSAAMARELDLTASDTVAALASYAFDMSVPELLTPLMIGAAVALIPPAVSTDPRALAEAIDAAGVTVMQATPTTWRMLLETGWTGPGLRAVAGAEAVPSALAAELKGRVEHLWNYYGPTETTVWSVAHRVVDVSTDRPLPIGRPMANTTVYVVDRRLRPVPVGVVGEILIGGDGVTRGYHGNAALTADRFVPDPFGGGGGRLYHTSDLARWRPDGTLEFLGRSDSQVKVRGHRVELAEVETALAAHPAVAQAAVTVAGEDSDRRLIGYVVRRGAGTDAAVLRAHVGAKLPEFMVPHLIVTLDAMPLSANGKVDRAALPAPTIVSTADRVAPRTALEREVTAVWADVLGRPDLGVHDDFFQSGGHSLHAIRVISRLRERLAVDVPVRELFAHPSPARFAAVLGRLDGTRGAAAPVPRPAGHIAPLSYAQRQLWFLDQLHAGRGDYNVHTVLRLRGPLDVPALFGALRGVVDRHEVLRSRFELRDGTAVQIAEPWDGDIARTDLTGLTPVRADARVRELAHADVERPLDLTGAPAFRVRLVRLAPAEHVLTFVVHHAAMDGWSWQVLRRELAEGYAAATAGRRPDLPDLPVQYADVAYHEQLAHERGEEAADLAYWRDRLDDAPDCELPTDRPRPATRSGRGAEVTFELSPAVTAAVRAAARGHDATLFMTLLAAFHVVVARYTHRRETLVGTPVAGRDRPGLERLVGCFVNFLTLRADLAGDPTFAELIGRVRADVLAAFAHQRIPFGRLVEELQPDRDASRNPFFQLMFTMEEADLGALELPGVRVEPVGLDETVAKFDLTATLTDHGETIAGSFVYATDLFEPATVERLARAYEHVVTAAVADTDRPLSRLTLADPVSPDGGVSGTGRAVPLPDLVAAQARRTPDAVAVQLGDETLTYADLDARADRLARWLADRGVTVDSPVGVALPRSPDLVVALLAVLKAGGAYVAVDPAHPTDRQAATFAHSGVRLVLTRRPAAALLPAGPHFAVHDLDDIGAAVRACAPTPLAAPIHLDTLAAIFTTSGSTGVPKAIATTHRGPANYMRYLAEVTGVSATDTVLQVAAPSFDASMREIFGALGHGARLLMLTDEQAKDPYAITRTITEHRVTALFSLVPSMLSAIAIAADDPSYDGASLRIGLVGGEALTGTHLRDAARVGPLMRVVNHYGPTECTMTSTYHVVTENDGAVPVGRPIIDARGYVVGLDGDALPAGALGELYLATPGLARGYVAAPDATAERFVPDPWGPPGGRLFRTGDLVRWRADDRLTFHGRLDDQIKLRGIRVEPGEIEAALRACSGVRAAAVVSRGESLRRELVACLVLDGDVAVEDLHARLAATLPAHLVPGRYAVLDALPHTPTGKVDRRRLGRMDLDRIGAAPGGASGAPARDALEMRMVTLWERLLERRPIGVNDNFFATGGHSLKAVELVDAVRREFGLPLPLNAVFTNPTIEGLCAVIGGSVAPAGLVVPLAVGAGGALPLFLVHPQGGDACCYAALARDLGADRDVYGIESVGYNTDEPPLNRVEAMAERYLAELREIRPDGPYALAGWSFGGNVAFEMAVRLEAAGETVAFLGAIDARVFGRDEAEEGYRERPAIERFGIAELARGDVDELAALDEQDFLDVVLREGRANGRLSLRADSDTMRRMLRVFTANGEAADHYRSTARVAVGVHLFKAMDTHPSLPNPVVDPAGWRERTNGRLHLVEMPGNHHDLVYPPRASALAERLRRAMTNPNQESAE